MRRDRWTGVVRVYRYGCLAPRQPTPELEQQFELARQLWNRCVDLFRSQQDAYRRLMEADPEVADLTGRLQETEAAIQGRLATIRSLRRRARSGTVARPGQDPSLQALRESRRGLREALRVARERVREERAAALKELGSEEYNALKALYHEFGEKGLFWPTVNAVLDDYRTAAARARREGRALRYHGRSSEGRLTVQIIGGMDVADLFGAGTYLQIDPVDPRAWSSPIRGERRKLSRTRVRFRIGSLPDRRPRWVELPMILHRPIPDAGRIQQAELVRRRVGSRLRWSLCITVREPLVAVPHPGRDVVGVDIGWRLFPDRLRVAYWADSQGKSHELALPAQVPRASRPDPTREPRPRWSILERLEMVQRLQSYRDRHFRAILTRLAQWFSGRTLPEPWATWEADLSRLENWRNPGTLHALLRFWHEHPLPGDAAILGVPVRGAPPREPQTLHEWAARDRHLAQYAADLRSKALGWRNETYRRFAAWLARTYRVIALEEIDLRRFARKPLPDQGTQGTLPPDRQRFVAGVSVLREAIVTAAQRYGAEVIWVPAAYSTRRCHACGHLEEFDQEREIIHQCGRCGAAWDQDYNAAKNLLGAALGGASGAVMPQPLEPLGVASQ